MVRPRFVTLALLALLASATAALPVAAESARPFDPLLPAIAAAAPGTYVVNGTALVPAPESARIPLQLQADVLRGPERPARVGIAVGAEPTQAGDVRLRVSTVAAAGQPARVLVDAGGAATPGPMRLVREFSLPPGDYEMEAVVGESRPGVGLVGVAKARLSVPDIRGGSLVATPIVVGEASKTVRPDNLPFIFGQTTLTPATDRHFPQGGGVSVAFRLYNWSAGEGERPDLTLEYLFYEQGTKGLHFFNKIKPQQLNAETLGASFDPSAGAVSAGMLVPLAAFTFGNFELVVKVTDNRSKQTTEQKVAFTVAP